MTENPDLLQQLKEILHRKKNNQYYATKLGISTEEVEQLREELKKQKSLHQAEYEEYPPLDSTEEAEFFNGPETIVETISDREKNTEKISFFHSQEALSDEEVYKEAKKDPLKWRIAQLWHLKKGKGFLHSVLFKPIEQESKENFQLNFIDFLAGFSSDYIPVYKESPRDRRKKDACLLIPKQDFHFDKADIGGDNNIIERQGIDISITELFVQKAAHNYNLRKVYYVLGSDYFNAEWTRMTTKGTPQQNCIGYHSAFHMACVHELFVLKQILKSADEVEVIYIAGNHDYYVGWHLVQWLAAYFKNEKRISIDASPDLRKYITYSDTAVMLAHGNEVKPQQLANIFPKEYKAGWSSANHFYMITGDKHKELSGDYGSIRHYGVPALSSAKSFWDTTNGYVANRTEHSAYIIEEGKGFSDFYREII